MKLIHYRNIGLPKTGTTWLWLQLSTHPDIDFFTSRTNDDKIQCIVDNNNRLNTNHSIKEKKFNTSDEYLKFYENYNISLNFDTWFFDNANNEILEKTSHLSLIFRNPYELLESWYNFAMKDLTSPERFFTLYHKNLICLTNYEKILNYWSKFNLKIMFYDDIINNPSQFVGNVCDFLEIKSHYDDELGKKIILKTDHLTKIILAKNLISYLNYKISYIENFTKRDLSHWKYKI